MYLVVKKYPLENNDIKYITITAIALWFLQGIISEFEVPLIGFISEILLVVIISIVLTGLLMIVRLMRPIVYRYPYIVVFMPFLIPVSYLLVIDVPAMKQIIMMTSQGVAMVVALMLSVSYWDQLKKGLIFTTGFIALILGYLIYWIFLDYGIAFGSIWQLLFAVGMICIIYSFSGVIEYANQHEN